MAHEERFGNRDLTYSAWHRRQSLGRFIDMREATAAAMIDLDYVIWTEYEDATKMPLMLIETAIDTGQRIKPATVTKNLANKAGIPAYTVLYTIDDRENPRAPGFADIRSFRMRKIAPDASSDWTVKTPAEFALWLALMRNRLILKTRPLMEIA